MLITVRARTGPTDQRRVIGRARFHVLLVWEVMPPLSAPGVGFGHLEVPQLDAGKERPVLLFSCLRTELSEERRAAGEKGGVWLLEPDYPLGPYDPLAARRITDESLYSGPLSQDRSGAWVLLAFHHGDEDPHFVGHISDPVPFATFRTAGDPFTLLGSAMALDIP